MTHEMTLLVAPLVPLIGAALVGLTGRSPNLRETVSVVTGLVLLALVAPLAPAVMNGARPEATVLEVLPGLPIAFALEPLGMVFALVASGLWIVTTLYAIGYMRAHDEPSQTRFYVCFALAISASVGIAFAANLFTLFIFYEALTLSTYPLVTHSRTAEAMRSGRVYLGVLLTTSISFLLLAVIWTWFLTGTLDFTPGGILAGKAGPMTIGILLALFAFGTGKAALMPFHKWLPAAMVAPTPVSALLHAVAVVKAGVFTVMKVIVYIFGLDLLTETGANEWLIYVSSGTIVLASLIAMTKDNLKARLAYSTISQLSYIVLGAALATQAAMIGGSMHIAMHAFGKITLFFCAGAIYVATHKKNISDMEGLGRAMPLTFAAFFIGSLSVIGLPPLGGMWSKWFLVLGAADAGRMIPIVVLMVSSLLNVAYLLPIPLRAFFRAPKGLAAGETLKYAEAPAFCLVPLCVTALGCVVLFFYADTIYRLLEGMG
ncbi:MAG: monovalent cation/H+ antiporter subunit D family protein [Gemmatimonadetes bacterium]|nr:monovalent cation/H+ antiporter subunit D family protein [Gemmatimonadota bacterium]